MKVAHKAVPRAAVNDRVRACPANNHHAPKREGGRGKVIQ